MWIVARVKIKELNIFKIKLIEKLGREIKFYHPKIEYSKYFKDILDMFILNKYLMYLGVI